MLCLSGFELYSHWVPLTADCVCPFKKQRYKKLKMSMVAYGNVCLCECQNKELEWDLKQDNAECKLNFNKFIILACTWHYGPYFTGHPIQ